VYLYTGVSVDDAVLLTCDRCSECSVGVVTCSVFTRSSAHLSVFNV